MHSRNKLFLHVLAALAAAFPPAAADEAPRLGRSS
jgi:hypothetical protein